MTRFKVRRNIKCAKLCGESADVDESVVARGIKEIRDVCKNYRRQDIYNMDETGLFSVSFLIDH